ncbi:MAG: hypothetical protein WDM70_10295 [Nitrosomonadales bacterium]
MKEQLITAAFFMEGLHEAQPGGYDGVLGAWDKGRLELVDALVSHVPLATQLCNYAAITNGGDYPGVFDYEVSELFGAWFGEYILTHGGDEPSRKEVEDWLVKAVEEFFSQ